MLVIGNGESRSFIDLDKIDEIKIGCNALYRDHFADHLVCVDRRMVKEAVDSAYKGIIYTRTDWINEFKKFENVKVVPKLPYNGSQRADEPFHWGSGPYAVLLGAKLSNLETIKLIGFDLYGSSKGTTNNVYKDTKNYNSSDKRAVDPRYWIYQIAKVFECSPQKKFVVYQQPEWEIPKAWIQSNVELDNINNFS